MLNVLNLAKKKNGVFYNLLKQGYKSLAQPVLFQIHRKKLLDHRLIFCINSGRCGSEYLAKLLGSAKDVKGYHEAVPRMIGQYLHMINDHTYAESYHERLIKNYAIKNRILRYSKGEVYCETNHMFIKTFFDVVLSDFKKVDVIILRRELSLVLKSFIQLDFFSDRSSYWPNWMSSPCAKTAALKCIAADDILDQYDLCIAYLLDIEARAIRFQNDYPWVRTHEVRVESLSDYSNVQKLFSNIDVTPTTETKKIYRKKINLREKGKKARNNDVDLEYCKDRIAMYIDKTNSMGISLPKSLALAPYNG
jgi:hypothetical protein